MPYKYTYYECTCCDTLYEREIDALMCEERHLLEGKDDNYSCYELRRIFNLIESRNAEPCDYCKHAYYVYGCEQECKYRNMGKCQIYGLGKGSKFSPKAEDIVKKFVVHKEEKEKLDDAGIRW